MISRIRGTVEAVSENRVELRCGELCYEVLAPSYMEHQLRPLAGDQVELFVQHYLEGGAGHASMIPRLVGFMSEAERSFYNHLVKVPGLGARSVLKSMIVTPAVMANAIEREDSAALSSLPGVGKRTADKIIATLKGKVTEFALEQAAASAGPFGEMEEEALAVLLQLSYRRSEAEQIIRNVKKKHPGLDGAEALVQAVLKEAGGAMR